MVTTESHAQRAVAAYDYTDAEGRLLYQVVRFETPDGSKTFRQRRPRPGGGWTWNLDGVDRVLYRLPKVLEQARSGRLVAVVEGEKDVEAVEAQGYVATCNAGGAGKWQDNYSETLRGARVAIIADDDEPGHQHAAAVAASLEGIAAALWTVKPAIGKDVSDHLAAGRTLRELVPFDPKPAEPKAEPSRRRSSYQPQDTDDTAEALKQIPARDYFERLIGTEIPERGAHAGKVLCPAHDERTPSCHVGLRGGDQAECSWFCYGCGAGGTIFDLAALLWNVTPRGAGFIELRDLLAATFPEAVR